VQFELEGSKYKIEYQKNKNDLVVEIDNPKKTVYLYKCQDVVLIVKGKVTGVTIGMCEFIISNWFLQKYHTLIS
jgi:adenylyl cyclase-associated protein